MVAQVSHGLGPIRAARLARGALMRRGTTIGHLPCLRELLGGVFIAMSVSGNYSAAWLTDHGHVHGVRRAAGWVGWRRHPGSKAKGQGKDMTTVPFWCPSRSPRSRPTSSAPGSPGPRW